MSKKAKERFEDKMRVARETVDKHLAYQKYLTLPRVSKGQEASKFEFLIKTLFERMGFSRIGLLGGPGDKGVDLVAYTEKRERIVIQCKHHQGNIPPQVIREFAHVIERDPSISKGYLVTTSGFSPEAKIYAQENEICKNKMVLIDRKKLIDLLKSHDLSLDYIYGKSPK